MTEQLKVVREIDWKEIFPFTLLFRAFRVAIHPSKLGLAFVALFLVWLGGHVLDGLWLGDSRAVNGEVQLYEDSLHAVNPPASFKVARDSARQAVKSDFAAALASIDKPNGTLSDVKYALIKSRDEQVTAADAALAKATAAKPTAQQLQDARDLRDQAVYQAYSQASERWRAAQSIDGVGPFCALVDFELHQAYRVVDAVQRLQFVGGDSVGQALISAWWIAPVWAFSEHWFYFVLFFVYLLAVRSIFGGAITRIAAVHVARDEKISIRQALAFSAGKFLSFFSAPLIPVVLVFLAGLVLALGGLVGNLPGIGPIIVGGGFFVALLLGFVMTLIILGTVGGMHLMYPTIAVEGSDSFDAISRSFSYVYAKPWRLGFYVLVSLIYGTIAFLFVRLFITLMLTCAHFATGLLIFAHADDTTPLWNKMWTSPMAGGRLIYDIDWLTLGAGQSAGAALLAIWVYIAIGLLGAFVLSFGFSAATIVYFLMRREVDSTELDDVYLEQAEEEFGEAEAVIVPPPQSGDDAPAAPPTNA